MPFAENVARTTKPNGSALPKLMLDNELSRAVGGVFSLLLPFIATYVPPTMPEAVVPNSVALMNTFVAVSEIGFRLTDPLFAITVYEGEVTVPVLATNSTLNVVDAAAEPGVAETPTSTSKI